MKRRLRKTRAIRTALAAWPWLQALKRAADREVRRVNDQRELLLRAAEKAGPRRFTGERITAMGELK